MEIIDYILPDHMLHALGWTVIHSLWQGLFAAFLLGLYLHQRPKDDARRRYWAGFLAMGATLAAAVITFFLLLESPDAGLAFFAEGTATGMPALGTDGSFTFAERLNENMPLVVLAWFIGMAFFLLRMMGGLLYVQRLKSRHLSAVPANWVAILERLKNELKISTPIKLSASALVKVPMVLGWLKPVVLMPIGAVNQLTVEQVEAILAHELAHIARYDYALNLLQSLIEVIFYFNPAVWWISANIRTERENCCDDLAVELCGNPLNYARALVSLQEMHQASPAFALSFASGKKQLLTRIQRILNQPHKNPNAMEKFSVIGLVLAAAIMLSMQAKTNFYPASEATALEEGTPPNDWVALARLEQDTLPKGTFHLQRTDDNEQVKIRMEDGEIKYLELNGEEIPKEEYGDYEEKVVEMLDNLPEPPVPPSAPDHIRLPEPPAPPAPPRPRKPGLAPAPPPAPPVPSPSARKIITERDGKKTIIIIEGGLGQEPIEIEVEGRRKGSVIINGKELENLGDGEESVIIEESLKPGLHFRRLGGDKMIFLSEDIDALGLEEARREAMVLREQMMHEAEELMGLHRQREWVELERLHEHARGLRFSEEEMKEAQKTLRQAQEKIRREQMEQSELLRRELLQEKGAM
jgi:beta-lactamase regulating signal transducer with metallopeptidase domain